MHCQHDVMHSNDLTQQSLLARNSHFTLTSLSQPVRHRDHRMTCQLPGCNQRACSWPTMFACRPPSSSAQAAHIPTHSFIPLLHRPQLPRLLLARVVGRGVQVSVLVQRGQLRRGKPRPLYVHHLRAATRVTRRASDARPCGRRIRVPGRARLATGCGTEARHRYAPSSCPIACFTCSSALP